MINVSMRHNVLIIVLNPFVLFAGLFEGSEILLVHEH